MSIDSDPRFYRDFEGIPHLPKWLGNYEHAPTPDEERSNAAIIAAACEAIRERWPRDPQGYVYAAVDVPTAR